MTLTMEPFLQPFPSMGIVAPGRRPQTVTGAELVVATDGAALRNPGLGGWGWVTEDGRRDSGAVRHTTNNRMELRAVLEALRTLDSEHSRIRVLSDSQYVVRIFSEWLPAWRARGMRTSDKRPVKNADLIEPIAERMIGREVTFEWVRGHDGHALNEAADALATRAAERAANDPDAEVDGATDPPSGEPSSGERRVVRSTTTTRKRPKDAARDAVEAEYQRRLADYRNRNPGPPPGAHAVPRSQRGKL